MLQPTSSDDALHSQAAQMAAVIAQVLDGYEDWQLRQLNVAQTENTGNGPAMVRLQLTLGKGADWTAIARTLQAQGLHCCRQPTKTQRGVFILPAASDMDFFLFVGWVHDH